MGGCCSSADSGNLEKDRQDSQAVPTNKDINLMKTSTKASGFVPKAPPPRRSIRPPPEQIAQQFQIQHAQNSSLFNHVTLVYPKT